MPDHREIYARHADEYQRLVAREDYQGNILRTLEDIRPLAGLDVVELGAGTGRLTCLLAPLVKRIQAFDLSGHMLSAAAARLARGGWANWRLAIADHRALPAPDGWADLVISGWSVCYLVVEHEETWRAEVGRALREMRRLLRPGGTILILETLGTGYGAPHAPDGLAEYYAFLEAQAFSSTWIRTDFRFESLTEAQTLVDFFFGAEMAKQVVERNWLILPECTGIWWSDV